MAKRTSFIGLIGGVPASGFLKESNDAEEMALARQRKEENECGVVCKTVKGVAVVGLGALIVGALASKK